MDDAVIDFGSRLERLLLRSNCDDEGGEKRLLQIQCEVRGAIAALQALFVGDPFFRWCPHTSDADETLLSWLHQAGALDMIDAAFHRLSIELFELTSYIEGVTCDVDLCCIGLPFRDELPEDRKKNVERARLYRVLVFDAYLALREVYARLHPDAALSRPDDAYERDPIEWTIKNDPYLYEISVPMRSDHCFHQRLRCALSLGLQESLRSQVPVDW